MYLIYMWFVAPASLLVTETANSVTLRFANGSAFFQYRQTLPPPYHHSGLGMHFQSAD